MNTNLVGLARHMQDINCADVFLELLSSAGCCWV